MLIYGSESWASNPAEDGRAKYFRNAQVELVQGAGHWVHHDRLEVFMRLLAGFLV
jgi:pimeloyl-ACP methyl ester carboxylesterase